jgi:hypothetical protein
MAGTLIAKKRIIGKESSVRTHRQVGTISCTLEMPMQKVQRPEEHGDNQDQAWSMHPFSFLLPSYQRFF